MPLKKDKRPADFDTVFIRLSIAVEKRISQLATYLETLEEEETHTVSACQQKILLTHIDRLRDRLDRLEVQWDNLRDSIPQADHARIQNIVEVSERNGEESLQKAELFVCQATQQSTNQPEGSRPSTSPNSSGLSGTTPGKTERLENTLLPTDHLNHDMTLEQATTWISKFDSWFEWNEKVLMHKSLRQQRILLEARLDANMVTVGFWCQAIHKKFLWRFDTIFGLKMMMKSGLEKIILKFQGGLQRYLLTCQANSAFLGRFFCTGQQQL